LHDIDEDDVNFLGEEENQTLLFARQAKQWDDSLICTPRAQPKSPTKHRNSLKSRTTSTWSASPKSSTQKPFKIRELNNFEHVFQSLNSILIVDLFAFSRATQTTSSCQPIDTCEPAGPFPS